ncbi:hypothetical protein MMC32_006118 [Xylographa parallela]|nr:hypothetical protein [Xylographa parallela]
MPLPARRNAFPPTQHAAHLFALHARRHIPARHPPRLRRRLLPPLHPRLTSDDRAGGRRRRGLSGLPRAVRPPRALHLPSSPRARRSKSLLVAAQGAQLKRFKCVRFETSIAEGGEPRCGMGDRCAYAHFQPVAVDRFRARRYVFAEDEEDAGQAADAAEEERRGGVAEAGGWGVF